MRQLLVFGEKTFKITIPDDAKVTFGPWSPPSAKGIGWDSESKKGTLRIYQGTEKNILACFAGVNGFRDLSLSYSEEVVKEEGATIWKDDQEGYVREDRVSSTKEWTDDPALLAAPKKGKAKK